MRKRQKQEWLARRLPAAPIRAIAGHEVEFSARKIFHEADGADIRWYIASDVATGPVMRWKPSSPGIYTLRAETSDGRSHRRPVVVGLRPADLVKLRDSLDCYFALIVRKGLKVHFIPLLKSETDRQPPEVLRQEVERQHPAFAKLLHTQTRIYRDRILPHPYIDASAVRTGLHAVFSRDLVYLGSAPIVREATDHLAALLGELADRETGRGEILAEIETAIAKLDPESYEYQSADLFPAETTDRLGPFSAERLTSGAVTSVLAAAQEFGRSIGLDLGPGGLTGIITFNTANGMLSTSLFDSSAGISRQVATAFEALPALSDVLSRGGGRGTPGGVSPFAQLGGDVAMNKEGGTTLPGSPYLVLGGDGSGVSFKHGPGGDPTVASVQPGSPDPDPDDWFTPGRDHEFDPVVIHGEPPPAPDPPAPDPPAPDPPAPDPPAPDPPGTDPEEMPAPDDGTGGLGPTTGGPTGGQQVPLGVVTFGGGYTDPVRDPEGGGELGGIRILPGGGVTDPVEDGGGGGFAELGGYNPPIDFVRDPGLNPAARHVAGAYAAIGENGMTHGVTDQGGVRVTSLAGTTTDGMRFDGLVGAATGAPPSFADSDDDGIRF